MIFNVKGIVAPVFTPMDEIGNVNLEVIQYYAQYLKEHEVCGVLVGGTTGEAALLNLSERKSLLLAWIQACKPLHVKVISQVGAAPIPDVLALAKYSEEAGADAIMTLPELYYKPKSVEDVVGYLESVSKMAPSLPLFYYHFPMMSGVDVNMKQLLTVASNRIPLFKGMKADLEVALQLANHLAADQIVFMANHHLATAALMGFDSCIATVVNLFPDLSLEIIGAIKNGDMNLAKIKQEKMNRLVDGITSYGEFVPAMKAAMELVTGIKVGPPRMPLRRIQETDLYDLEDQLKALDVL